MRLLVDQDVYAATGQFLRDLDHDLVTAARLAHALRDVPADTERKHQ